MLNNLLFFNSIIFFLRNLIQKINSNYQDLTNYHVSNTVQDLNIFFLQYTLIFLN